MKKRANYFLPLLIVLMLVLLYTSSNIFYGNAYTYNDYEKLEIGRAHV